MGQACSCARGTSMPSERTDAVQDTSISERHCSHSSVHVATEATFTGRRPSKVLKPQDSDIAMLNHVHAPIHPVSASRHHCHRDILLRQFSPLASSHAVAHTKALQGALEDIRQPWHLRLAAHREDGELHVAWGGMRILAPTRILPGCQDPQAAKLVLAAHPETVHSNHTGHAGVESITASNMSATSLDLSWNEIKAAGAKQLAEMLAVDQKTVHLNLRYNGIRAEGAKHVAKMLQRNTTVRSLDLWSNGIGDEGAKHLARALERNATLRSVNLRDNNIQVTGAKDLASAIAQNTTVTDLDLSHNFIRPEGAVHIAAMLQCNSTVKNLNLWGNRIGDLGMEALASALRVNRTVRHLNLRYNGISGQGAKHLASVLRHNAKVTLLDMSDNDLEEESKSLVQNAWRHELGLQIITSREEGCVPALRRMPARVGT